MIQFDHKRYLMRIFTCYEPKIPNVEATPLHPPSIANLTMFSGSK